MTDEQPWTDPDWMPRPDPGRCRTKPGTPENSLEMLRRIRAETDSVILSFSAGKDSIATWIAIEHVFPHIYPYYLYDQFPDIDAQGRARVRPSFVEDSLTYYEEVFGTHIERVPTPQFYKRMVTCTFQPPSRRFAIDVARFEDYLFDYDDIRDALAERNGLEDEAWHAIGIRATDNILRRTAVRRYGAVNYKRRTFWPVFDWLKADLIRAIQARGVRMPVDYQMWPRSYDGIGFQFIPQIREHFPEDWEAVQRTYPLLPLDLVRYKLAKKYGCIVNRAGLRE